MRDTALQKKLDLVGKRFRISGELYSTTVLTEGNVNRTYKLNYRRSDGSVKGYIAQRINPYVFRHLLRS